MDRFREILKDEDKDFIFWKLMAKPDNWCCFDCNAKNPNFGDVWFGIFVCKDCAQTHTDSSEYYRYTRGIWCDWNHVQLRRMIFGGNYKAKLFFKEHGWIDDGAKNIKAKYTSNVAMLYKQLLLTEVMHSMLDDTETIDLLNQHLSAQIEETDVARSKFSNAKSISSSQFAEDQEVMIDAEAWVLVD